MADAQEVWWRPGGRSPFALDPTKPFWPQFASAVGQCLIIFVGPVLRIVAIDYYPFLIQDRTIYVGGLSGVVFWSLASFAIFSKNDFPRGIPGLSKLEFRAGFGPCMTGLLLGLGSIANGYNTPLVSRDVAVVAKHTTRHRDPANPTYYVAMLAWPPSRTVVELVVPRSVYETSRCPRDRNRHATAGA
jgi:hypothetical protein